MTAEIAIANKHAVALAADSKVTISSTGMSKGYDTANKVFTLSKQFPVGIMIFGNAEFMGYPWETIIKQFRKIHGISPRSHISVWAEDFQKFLRSFGNIQREHKSENIRVIVDSILSELEDSARRGCDTTPGASASDYIKALNFSADAALDAIQSVPVCLNQRKAKSLIRTFPDDIAQVVAQRFGNYADKPLIEKSAELSVLSLTRAITCSNTSGFVIAGFGEKEMFPTVMEFKTNGYIGNSLEIIAGESTDISRTQSASVRAFAQGDMVQSFMDGYDVRLMAMMGGMFQEALRDSCLSVLSQFGRPEHQTDEMRQEIKSAADLRIINLFKDFEGASRATFSDPVMTMVNLLPKDELAHLAESLVALTSLKRRVSRELETVGGAIDVALISKGDGFVWIKRKHYFQPELNPNFFRNYNPTEAR